MAFIILSNEKRSTLPSRLVMVKFLISIDCQFWETFPDLIFKKFPILENYKCEIGYKVSKNFNTLYTKTGKISKNFSYAQNT